MIEKRAERDALAIDPTKGMLGDGEVWCGWWMVSVMRNENWERKEIDRSRPNNEYAVIRKEHLDAIVQLKMLSTVRIYHDRITHTCKIADPSLVCWSTA